MEDLGYGVGLNLNRKEGSEVFKFGLRRKSKTAAIAVIARCFIKAGYI